METYAPELTGQKSFDVLSSVRLYRYDLQDVGYIRPETRQRVFDEELSYIAEGISRPNFTEFVLHQEDGELVYFHEGQWRPYLATLITGLRVAEAEAADDPRKQFEAERRAADLRRGYQLRQLPSGRKLSWYYEFPSEQLASYGEELLGDMGFYPKRAMGYLCEAEKTADGRLILRHQSVDNSDRDGFSAAMSAAVSGGSIEEMTAAYDGALSRKYGGEYYAGRPLDGQDPEENAWPAIIRHRDLVEYLMDQIEAIARSQLAAAEIEIAKKRLTYGVWARLKEKLDEQSLGVLPYQYASSGLIQSQVETAYQSAAARGEVLFGCGGAITGEKSILQAESQDVFSLIFGAEKRWFGCAYCGAKQYGDPCASHLYCPSCTAEVKNGEVISTGRLRSVKKSFLDILADDFAAEWRKWSSHYQAVQQEKQANKLTNTQNT